MLRNLATYLGYLFPSRSHLALLGFAIPQIWMYAIAQQANGLSSQSLFGYHVASIVVLIAAAIVLRLSNARIPRWTVFIASIGMTALPLYQAAVSLTQTGTWQSEFAPLESCLAIFGGAGCAWCFLTWFDLCCSKGPRDSIEYLLLSFGAMAAFRLVLALIPTTLALLTLACIALATPFLTHVAKRLPPTVPNCWNQEQANRQAIRPRPTRQTATIIAELALYSFVLGLMSPVSSESQGLTPALVLNYVLRIVFVAVLFVWIALRKNYKVIRLAQVAFCCTLIFVLALVLLGDRASLVAAALLSFVRSVVLILLTIACTEIVFSYNVRPFFAFGIGRGIYEAALLGGTVTSNILPQETAAITASLNVVFFVIACFSLAVGSRTIRTMSNINRDAMSGNNAEAIEKPDTSTSLEEIADKYSLTTRETEVLELLRRGRSKAYIAEVLSISENTVRHHSKDLYTKLGIHSREELMDLLPLSQVRIEGDTRLRELQKLEHPHGTSFDT